MLWAPIQSNHMLTKYVKESLPFTPPQEICLSESAASNHVLYYVPIGSVLANMLKSDDIAENVLGACYDDSNTNVLCDIIDGSFTREKAILCSGDVETIILLLYTDELELVNPLGSAAGVHKILAAYFSVLNLHPKYRSRLSAIHLVMLVKYSHVKAYGMNKVLGVLIRDILSLHEDGLQFSFRGSMKKVRVRLLGVVGDNLSLNRIGGFSSSFGGGHFCRFCLTDSKDINKATCERNCEIRTAALHEGHIVAVEDDHRKARLYGVSSRSPLLQIPDFDVTQQLPPDAMHDILEGGIAFVLKHVLKSLAASGVISVLSMTVISTFKYGFHDGKSKPVPLSDSFLSSGGNIRGTASQKWCLFRLLPQMISHLVPEEHPAWHLYLLYRHIVDIILASKIPTDSITYLEVQIDIFLHKFVELFPDQKLIPKMHFLIHYPRFIQMYGPPRMYWSMRFEAKHSYFKNIAMKSKSFRNVCKTMSTRGQFLQSYEFSAPVLARPLVTSAQKSVTWTELPDSAKSVFPVAVTESEKLVSVQSASIDASNYRVGDICCASWKDEAPLFVEVFLMIVHRGTLLIFTEELRTLQFNQHRHCYQVERSGMYHLLPPGQHSEYSALDLYKHQDKYEVIPHFELYEEDCAATVP